MKLIACPLEETVLAPYSAPKQKRRKQKKRQSKTVDVVPDPFVKETNASVVPCNDIDDAPVQAAAGHAQPVDVTTDVTVHDDDADVDDGCGWVTYSSRRRHRG